MAVCEMLYPRAVVDRLGLPGGPRGRGLIFREGCARDEEIGLNLIKNGMESMQLKSVELEKVSKNEYVEDHKLAKIRQTEPIKVDRSWDWLRKSYLKKRKLKGSSLPPKI